MLENFCTNYDPTFEPCFYGHWCDYEEFGWILVFEKDKKYYSIENGHCVYSPGSGDKLPDFQKDLDGPLSEEDIWDIMVQWKDKEDEWW